MDGDNFVFAGLEKTSSMRVPNSESHACEEHVRPDRQATLKEIGTEHPSAEYRFAWFSENGYSVILSRQFHHKLLQKQVKQYGVNPP
jgi:hypothetical protein